MKFLSLFSLGAIAFSTISSVNADDEASTFMLPPLSYDYDALEPHFDAKTMEIHHSKHHQAFITNLNDVAMAEPGTWSNLTLTELVKNLPTDHYQAKKIRNSAGGHYNHSLFWKLLSKTPSMLDNSSTLAEAIETNFGTMDGFKQNFTTAAGGVFGSGWAWLVVTPESSLAIVTTPNQDSPLMDKDMGVPIMGLDVWEHAYYLKYQNVRAGYIESFWKVLDWSVVADYYESAMIDGAIHV